MAEMYRLYRCSILVIEVLWILEKPFHHLPIVRILVIIKEAYVLTNTTEGEWSTMAVLNNDTADDKEIAIPASREYRRLGDYC